MNRITSPGMPGRNDNDMVLTYYYKCDIIQTKNERGCRYVREDKRIPTI